MKKLIDVLLEWRMSELIRQTARIVKKRAEKCSVKLLEEDLDKLVWEYVVRCKGGMPDGWRSLYSIDKERTLKEKRGFDEPGNWHILVTCECPAFVYWGPDYLAYRNKFLYGKPMGNTQLPKRNITLAPGTKYATRWSSSLTCKHIAAVLPDLQNRWKKNKDKIIAAIKKGGEK